MLGYRRKIVQALKHLSVDKNGLASLEYVIVAACVVTAVAAAFNPGASNSIANALTIALNTIGTAVTTAVGG